MIPGDNRDCSPQHPVLGTVRGPEVLPHPKYLVLGLDWEGWGSGRPPHPSREPLQSCV
jgi:hypothetical protein